MRAPLADIDGRHYDVAVIGAGINGAGVAQRLAAEGYSVLLIDKGDYCSGTSSRSSRIMHCGLSHFAQIHPIGHTILHPSRLTSAFKKAREAMLCRRDLVRTTSERVSPMRFHIPLWKTDSYRPWQANLALRALSFWASSDVPLEFDVSPSSRAHAIPLIGALRNKNALEAAVSFREYQLDWPERVGVDAALDAARMGATVRNYTAAVSLDHIKGYWRVRLRDGLMPMEEAVITAKVVLNMTGIWIDRINQSADEAAQRKVTGTKGVHIAVQLPPEWKGNGLATQNRLGEGFYCIPWRDMHYFGPTETLFEGNIDDIRPTEGEIGWLLSEANHLLPSLNLRRNDVLYAWAGVRPLTYDPEMPMGKRSRDIHDLSKEGLPNMFALTAGPLLTYRTAGDDLVEMVQTRISPSGPRKEISYEMRRNFSDDNTPPLDIGDTLITRAALHYSATHEHVTNLVDLLFRRFDVGWSKGMASGAAQEVAGTIAEIMGWDDVRIEAEVSAYEEYLRDQHAFR